jgi:hypothetical protein
MKHRCTMTVIMESVGYTIWLSGIAMLEVLPLMLLCIGCQHAAPPAAATSASRLSTTQPAHAAQVATAKDLFYKAVAGELDSLPLSLQMFWEMGGGDSADPQIVAYTGAALLLKASHASLLEKGPLANEGLSLEDKAVVLAPNDLEVRFLRGVTCYRLPRFMGRSATADLAYVAQVAEQAANDGRLDRRAAAADLVYYGKELEDHYDAAGAEAAWRAAVRINPDGSAGRDALKHLAEHRVTP